MPNPTRVILVRHGRSTFNDQGRYQGSSNQSVLAQQGIETSHLVGQHLSHTPIDIIYASPLKRVRQTAQAVLKGMGKQLPITTASTLKEISLSIWEGLTYQQVREQFFDDYQRWQHHPHDFELPSGPSVPCKETVAVATDTYFPVRDLYRSARQFWAELLSKHEGHTILIVSHSGTIHALISTALGISSQHHHSLQQSNCGISELAFSQQSVQLHQLNQTTAIEEVLPKLKISKRGLRLLLLASDSLRARDRPHLAKRLNEIPIDFYLSTEENKKHIHTLTQDSSKALWLSAHKADFLQDWQQHLCQSRQPAENLMTGLAIAPTRSIQKLLAQTLGSCNKSDRIIINPAKLSCIHYSYTHRPVVQAVNI